MPILKSKDDDDGDQQEVVATICQLNQEDARIKGKVGIRLGSGPVWEATPLPRGAYEFVARTEAGLQVMRWVLRGGKSRRVSSDSPSTQPHEGDKRFTFSIIDPHTRRHPILASMTENQLEVFEEYKAVVQSSIEPTSPIFAMPVVSKISDRASTKATNVVPVDDELHTFIMVTAIWVAFREGWSQNFGYRDPLSVPNRS